MGSVYSRRYCGIFADWRTKPLLSGIPMKDVTYVAGTGTNALTFTVTLTEDFEVTPDVNNAIKNLKPVTGTVKDIIGNQ